MPPQISPFWLCHECGAQTRPIDLNGTPTCASCGSEFIEILDEEVNPDPRHELPHPPVRPSPHQDRPQYRPQDHYQDRPYDRHNNTNTYDGATGTSGGGLLSGLYNAFFGGGGESAHHDNHTYQQGGRGNAPGGSPRPEHGHGPGGFYPGPPGMQSREFNLFGGTLRVYTPVEPVYRRGPPPGYGQGHHDDGLEAFFPGFGATGNRGPGPRGPVEGADLIQALLAMIAEEGGAPLGLQPGRSRLGDYVMTEQGFQDILERLMQAAGPQGPIPASNSVIDGLPRIKLDKTMLDKSQYKDCPVCKDDFTVGEQVVQLPCGHLYHPDCIVPWLKTNGSCPVCRFSLVPDEIDNSQSSAAPSSTPAQATPGDQAAASPVTGVLANILNRLWGPSGATSSDQQSVNIPASSSSTSGPAAQPAPTPPSHRQEPNNQRPAEERTGSVSGVHPDLQGLDFAPSAPERRIPTDETTPGTEYDDPPVPIAGDPPSPPSSDQHMSSAIPQDYRAKHAQRERELHEQETVESSAGGSNRAPSASRHGQPQPSGQQQQAQTSQHWREYDPFLDDLD